MKVLFTCLKIVSHFMPLLPFAKELQARGHDVRFAALAEMSDEITRQGFAHLVLVGPTPLAREEFRQRVAGIEAKDIAEVYVPQFFMGVLASSAVRGLVEALQDWRPDMIVRETTEFAGLVAAEKLGIRHIRLEILNGEYEEAIASQYASEIDTLRGLVSLPPAGAGYLKDEVAFSAHPQALDDTPRVNSRPPFRYLDGAAGISVEPSIQDWLPKDGLPMIYATFGTAAAGITGATAIYRIALEAFTDLPAHVLLTIGNGAPPDLIKQAPPNVTVRSFVPQADVLPHADLLVCHGGSGTVVAGLAAGVPMVITPLFADQPHNARCLAAAGLCLAVTDLSAPALRSAVIQALGDDDMRDRARAAANEIASMFTVDRAIDRLLSGQEHVRR